MSDKMSLGGNTPEEKHLNAWKKREMYDPCPLAARTAAAYRRDHGLPEPSFGPDGLLNIQADLGRARMVASLANLDMARRIVEGEMIPAETRAAYDDLVKQTAAQLKAIESSGVKVEYLSKQEIIDRGLDPEGLNPYPTAKAQRDDIDGNGRLMIASLVDYPESYHPILDSSKGGTYDQFRAVHDYFGHAAVGTGFDRHGEFQAWLHHTSMFTGPARKAASSELHVENSFLATTGQSAPHFSYLLPDSMVEPFEPDGTFKGAGWVKRGDVAVAKHASHDQSSHGNRGGARSPRGGDPDVLDRAMHLMDRLVGRFSSGKRSPKDQAALDSALQTLVDWDADSASRET